MTDRKRESNFSSNEKQLLISIISNYAHIIEDKKSDRTSMEAKNQAWKRVEMEFNNSSTDGTYRKAEKLKKFFCNKKHDIRILKAEDTKLAYLDTTDNSDAQNTGIKEFYENEKKKVKKSVIEENKFLNKTGCGKLPIRKIDGTEELMMSIINNKTVYGLPPYKFDSDNGHSKVQSNNENLEFIYVQNETSENNLDLDDNLNIVNSEENHFENNITPECSGVKDKTWRVGSGFSAQQFSVPLNPLLKNNKLDDNENEKANEFKTPSRKRSCSRRRPTGSVKVLTSSLFAEKYDLLLDKRLILTDKLIEDLEEERSFKKKEHKLKLELLQLQVEELKKK